MVLTPCLHGSLLQLPSSFLLVLFFLQLACLLAAFLHSEGANLAAAKQVQLSWGSNLYNNNNHSTAAAAKSLHLLQSFFFFLLLLLLLFQLYYYYYSTWISSCMSCLASSTCVQTSGRLEMRYCRRSPTTVCPLSAGEVRWDGEAAASDDADADDDEEEEEQQVPHSYCCK